MRSRVTIAQDLILKYLRNIFYKGPMGDGPRKYIRIKQDHYKNRAIIKGWSLKRGLL